MSYPATLAELGEQAAAPREPDAPTLVSTFAGMGGSTLGYLAAGYREVLAADHHPHAAACLRLNFGCPVFDGDIAQLDPAALELDAGQLDLLDGSPPCQGFSHLMVGDRTADPRNFLFRQFVRLLEAWQPKTMIMENVPGLHADRPTFAAVWDALTGAGYKIRAATLPAGYFGAATVRKRLIIAGVRADLGIAPSHPAPAARPVPIREAWAGITEPGIPAPPPLTERTMRLALLIRPGRSGMHAMSERGGRPSYYSLNRLDWAKPSPALTALFRSSDYLHPDAHRYLTVGEMMRIQGVPDSYRWPAGTSYGQAHARIGNSVAPLLTRALGQHLRKITAGALAGATKG